MTVVSHEREPGELGYVARYTQGWSRSSPSRCARTPIAYGAEQVRDLGWAIVEAEMLRAARVPPAVGPPRRHRPRPRGLGRQAADDRRSSRRSATPRSSIGGTGHGGGDDTWLKVYLYSRAQSVMGGTSQIQRNLVATPHPRAADVMTELRPARRDPGRGRRPDPDRPPQPARAAQRHQPRAAPGPGRAVPADRRRPRRPGRRAHRQRPGLLGRRRLRLPRRARPRRRAAGARRSSHGRQIVTGMVACRVPVVAAVNGPAVGLGCSLVGAVRHRVHGRERAPRRSARRASAWSPPTAGR